MSWTISACADGFLFSNYGLQGCGVNTSAAGTYQLAFFIVYGEARVEVHRTLTVLDLCAGVPSSMFQMREVQAPYALHVECCSSPSTAPHRTLY